jgi:hypothetical protein
VVENFFSEMREGNDMPTTLQFAYKFSSCTRETVKRLSTTSFKYYTSSSSYYKRPAGFLRFAELPKMEPPNRHTLTNDQLGTLHNWRVENGQSVRQATVRNFSTKDKPGTLPVNVYMVEEPTPQPLDLSRQTDHTVAQLNGAPPVVTNKQIIACVKAGFHPKEARPSPFYLACLEEPLKDTIQVADALWFSQDICHPLNFVKDLRGPLHVKAIVCCVETYSRSTDDTDTVRLREAVYQELLQATRDEGDMLTNEEQQDQDVEDEELTGIDCAMSIFTESTTTTRSGRASKRRDDREYVYF